MAEPAGQQGPVLLLDGMSLAFRAFFALPDTLATSEGVVTNAVHGFVQMLVNLVRDRRPSGIAVAYDLAGGTFRDEVVDDYKGGRDEVPDLLTPQFDMIRDVLDALGIPVVALEGFEADDVLATLAARHRDLGHDVVIVTGDRDAFQLVEDPHVRVLYNKRGVSDYALYDTAGIVERTGVRPEDYPFLAAMRGDPSDNLPGVPGVGEKTAAKLVNQYHDVDTLYAHLGELTPKLRENLAASEDLVRRNLAVIPLKRDLDLDVGEDDLAVGGWDRGAAEAVFAQLEMRNSWGRLAKLLEEGALGPQVEGSGTRPSAGPGVLGAVDASAWAHHRLDAATAVTELDRLGAGTTCGVGVVWSGEPGRSEPLAVAWAPAGATTAWCVGADAAGDPAFRSAFGSAFSPERAAAVTHGAKELMRWLLERGVAFEHLAMDVGVAAYLVDPARDDYPVDELALDHLATSLPHGVPSGRQGAFALEGGEGEEGALARAGDLALACAALLAPLTAALEAIGEDRLEADLERPLVGVLARMEVVGIAADRELLVAIGAELAGECRRLEAEVHRLAGGPFTINSVPQLREVLYDRLGLTPGRKTKTGYSTDARTLEGLRDQHPIVDALLRYREVEKLRSTYGESLAAEVGPDGRIHATFRQTVARTGRISSDHPNLHNIPVRTEEGRRLRRAFVASPGCRLLVADYDQIELRAIAHLSGDPGLTRAFTHGEDVHRAVAARVFGVPADEVTHAQRSTAKMVSYGLAYGMEAFGLSQRLAVPVEEARGILDSYFEAFPSVRAYMEATVEEARAKGYTVTEFGRRRPLPELRSANRTAQAAAERQAMNAGIQGLAADIFKVALVRLDAALRERDLASRLVLQVHDEVLVDGVADEAEEVESLVRATMEGAGSLRVPLVVSSAWGASWADAKG